MLRWQRVLCASSGKRELNDRRGGLARAGLPLLPRELAEETLRQVLEDEPDWVDVLEVVAVELGSASEN